MISTILSVFISILPIDNCARHIVYNLTYKSSLTPLDSMLTLDLQKLTVLGDYNLNFAIVDSCEVIPTPYSPKTESFYLPERINKCRNINSINMAGVNMDSLPRDLIELQNLTNLNISFTKISIAKYRTLLTQVPNLEYLNVVGCKYSLDDLSFFERHRPDLKVIHEQQIIDNTRKYDIVVFDTYICFGDSLEKKYFIESSPDEIKRCIIDIP